MINYFNLRHFKDDYYLLTNDFGAYSFATKTNIHDLLNGQVEPGYPMYNEWVRNGFILPDNLEIAVSQTRDMYRSAKNYLFSATSLHIFVVTNYCNANCIYCQARDASTDVSGHMSFEIAERGVDIALSSPEKHLSFEFQGGEPLANFSTIQRIVEYAEVRKGDHIIEYSIVSNLTLLTDDIIDYILKRNISIATSLDGHQALHDTNRPFKSGGGTYNLVQRSIKKLMGLGMRVGAIQTTSRFSLPYAKEIIDLYINLGFSDIFVRPLTPLGYAKGGWDTVGYSADEFISFYRKTLEYIIRRNLEGYELREGHASIFLRKILTCIATNYMELRSPCGAVIGQLAYYYNGDIFTCDEGRMLYEMGNPSFRIGNVHTSTYDQIIDSQTCKAVCASSILEAIPSCCDCVYQPYCGTCPVLNADSNNNIISSQNNGYRCKIYKGMLDAIFEVLYRNQAAEVDVLKGWC